MKKRRIAALFFALLTILLVTAIVLTVERVNYKEEVQLNLRKLPRIELLSLDSLEFKLPLTNRLFLVIFDPDCNLCLAQVSDLRENIQQFREYTMVLASTQPILNLRKFASTAGLNYPNVYFVNVSHSQVLQHFGTLAVPHTFVYDKDSSLLLETKGPHRITSTLRSVEAL